MLRNQRLHLQQTMLDRAELLSLNAEKMIHNYPQVILKPILSEISRLSILTTFGCTLFQAAKTVKWTERATKWTQFLASRALFDSVQYLNFVKKWINFIFDSILLVPKIQLKLLFNSKDNSIRNKIWWFNSQDNSISWRSFDLLN